MLRVLRWCSVAFLLVTPGLVLAQGKPAGRVVEIHGDANAVLNAAARTLAMDSPVYVGERVTSKGADLRIELAYGAVVQLGPGASMTVSAHAEGRRTSLRLWVGRLWAKVSSGLGKSGFEIKTDNAVCGVRGTSFMVESIEGGGSNVTVYEGEVELRSETSDQVMMVKAGTSASASPAGDVKAGGGGGTDPLGKVDPSRKDEEVSSSDGGEENEASKVPDAEKLKQASAALERMNQIYTKVVQHLSDARAKKDLVKLNCVIEKKSGIAGLLKVAEKTGLDLQDHVASGRKEEAAHSYALIMNAAASCEQLFAESEACIGELAVYSGDTEIEVTEDETVPEGDPIEADTALPPVIPVKLPDASQFQ